VARAEVMGDVGAVTSAGGRQQTCRTREKRAGEGRDRAGALPVRGKILCVHASWRLGFGVDGAGLLVLGLIWKRGRVREAQERGGCGQEWCGLEWWCMAPWSGHA
jgi:hypothetical protein